MNEQHLSEEEEKQEVTEPSDDAGLDQESSVFHYSPVILNGPHFNEEEEKQEVTELMQITGLGEESSVDHDPPDVMNEQQHREEEEERPRVQIGLDQEEPPVAIPVLGDSPLNFDPDFDALSPGPFPGHDLSHSSSPPTHLQQILGRNPPAIPDLAPRDPVDIQQNQNQNDNGSSNQDSTPVGPQPHESDTSLAVARSSCASIAALPPDPNNNRRFVAQPPRETMLYESSQRLQNRNAARAPVRQGDQEQRRRVSSENDLVRLLGNRPSLRTVAYPAPAHQEDQGTTRRMLLDNNQRNWNSMPDIMQMHRGQNLNAAANANWPDDPSLQPRPFAPGENGATSMAHQQNLQPESAASSPSTAHANVHGGHFMQHNQPPLQGPGGAAVMPEAFMLNPNGNQNQHLQGVLNAQHNHHPLQGAAAIPGAFVPNPNDNQNQHPQGVLNAQNNQPPLQGPGGAAAMPGAQNNNRNGNQNQHPQGVLNAQNNQPPLQGPGGPAAMPGAQNNNRNRRTTNYNIADHIKRSKRR